MSLSGISTTLDPVDGVFDSSMLAIVSSYLDGMDGSSMLVVVSFGFLFCHDVCLMAYYRSNRSSDKREPLITRTEPCDFRS